MGSYEIGVREGIGLREGIFGWNYVDLQYERGVEMNRYKKDHQSIVCVGKVTIFCDPCGDNDWLNSLKR